MESLDIQKFLNYVSESMPGNFYWKDLHGNYLGVNNNMIMTLGFQNKNDMIGKNDKDLWPDFAEELSHNDKLVISSGEPQYLEETIIRNDKKRYFTVIKTPLRDSNDNIFGIIGNSLDITELRETQEKLKIVLQNNSLFISIVTHEIGGPVSNVIMLANLMREENKNNRSKKDLIDNLDIIENEAKSSLERIKMVRRYLDLEQTDVNSDVNMSNLPPDFINTIVKNYSPHKGVEIQIDNHLDSSIKINGVALFEILDILIKNAIRFTDKGHIKIHLDKLNHNNTKDLQIKIEDTGNGMSESQLNNLFNTFLNPSNNDSHARYQKPSLGLALVQKILELNDGSIKVESKQGSGTVVSIKLPCESSKSSVTNKIAVKPVKSKSNKHILLVEDDKLTSTFEKQILEKLGFSVDVALTAEQALSLADKSEYFVIFMDISLPDSNGIEVMQKIQNSKQNKNNQTPFIALTSHSGEHDVDNFIEAGFMTVLTKPASREEFEACLNAVENLLTDNNNN